MGSTLSETEIANLALSHLGVGKEIGNIDTENSQEAKAARKFFEIARDSVLRDFPWPFATKIDTLGLVESDPNEEWGYSYRHPSDCLYIRRILSGSRNDTRESKVVYKVAQDDTGGLIYTDMEDAELEYTMRVTDTAQFAPDFAMALSFRLAAYIAPRITSGDRFKMGERAMQMYAYELEKARVNAIGEEQPDIQPESEFIRGRE